MATRGRKPKPTTLHLVEATTNVTRHAAREEEPKPTGKLVKPAFIKAGSKAEKLWNQYSEIGYWLTDADSHALACYCGLAAEMEKSLKNMNSSRISQWRTLGSELGFFPSSRSRINVGAALLNKSGKEKDPDEEFFGDAGKQAGA